MATSSNIAACKDDYVLMFKNEMQGLQNEDDFALFESFFAQALKESKEAKAAEAAAAEKAKKSEEKKEAA